MDDSQAIYNRTPCYLFSFSNEGYITSINATLLNHLGYAEMEVLNCKKAEELLTVGSKIFFQTHFYPLVKMQEKATEIFLFFLTKSGLQLPVLLNVALYYDGDAVEIHCGGMQISQRNRFEKELLEAKNTAQKALYENTELIAARTQLQENQKTLEHQLQQLSQANETQSEINKVLAHDLQEPLRKISLFSSKLLLDYEQSTNPKAFGQLQKIITFVSKVRGLLDGLGRFNAIDSKSIVYSMVDLSDILDKAAAKADIHASDTSITISKSDFQAFDADEGLLVKLFYELFSNALKFRKPGKMLKISIKTEIVMQNIFLEIQGKYNYEPFVRISFSDNGRGISPTSGNIFHIFRKAHHSENDLGMGLAYCRRIAEVHKGHIDFKSTEGKGAAFIIVLPAKNR